MRYVIEADVKGLDIGFETKKKGLIKLSIDNGDYEQYSSQKIKLEDLEKIVKLLRAEIEAEV